MGERPPPRHFTPRPSDDNITPSEENPAAPAPSSGENPASRAPPSPATQQARASSSGEIPAPPRQGARSRTTLAWLQDLVEQNPILRDLAARLTKAKCTLCNRPGPRSMPFVTMYYCEHEFHFSCIYTYLAAAVRRGQELAEGQSAALAMPVVPPCPTCGVPSDRPIWPSIIDARKRPNLDPTIGLTDRYVWDWFHYHLQLERDREARALTFRPPGSPPPADVQYADLAPLRDSSNFFEMVNACWLCKRLIGNEPWVRLRACLHAFHTYCLVIHLNRPSLSEQCPLCGVEIEFIDNCNIDVPLDTPVSHHRKKMCMDAFWYCLQYVKRQRPPGGPPPPPPPLPLPPPPPPGPKRTRSEAGDDDASVSRSGSVRRRVSGT